MGEVGSCHSYEVFTQQGQTQGAKCLVGEKGTDRTLCCITEYPGIINKRWARPLLKKYDINKWRDIPRSWIGRLVAACAHVCVCVCLRVCVVHNTLTKCLSNISKTL